jgi:hypothetical protein
MDRGRGMAETVAPDLPTREQVAANSAVTPRLMPMCTSACRRSSSESR